jgi:hypothetical protein
MPALIGELTKESIAEVTASQRVGCVSVVGGFSHASSLAGQFIDRDLSSMMNTSAVIAEVSPACAAHAASGETFPGPGPEPPAPVVEMIPVCVLVVPVLPVIPVVAMLPVPTLEPVAPLVAAARKRDPLSLLQPMASAANIPIPRTKTLEHPS